MMAFQSALPMKGQNIVSELAAEGELHRAWSREEFARRIAPLVPSLHRLCLTLADSSEAAEDLLQSSLVKAYVHRDSYRSEGPLMGWLYWIVRNEHAELVRHAARRRGLVRSALDRFGVLFEDWIPPAPTDPERSMSVAEDTASVLASMQSLPEAYRAVVWMCDVEDLSYEAVSQALHIPVGTVKSRHARGRARLRAALDASASKEEP